MVELYTVKEVAALLKVSPKTIHRRLDAGLLGCKRDGRSIRITQEHLDAYLASIEVPRRLPRAGLTLVECNEDGSVIPPARLRPRKSTRPRR